MGPEVGRVSFKIKLIPSNSQLMIHIVNIKDANSRFLAAFYVVGFSNSFYMYVITRGNQTFFDAATWYK